MKHHSTCHADYPEKVEGEKAQEITCIDIGNDEEVVQCNDCGAYEIQKSSSSSISSRMPRLK